jgi:thiamine-phosphate diphosphorylase
MPKLKLHCISCPRQDLSYEEQAVRALRGGADVFQLRDDSLTIKELLRIGEKIREFCKKNNATFIVNNRPDAALALDVDGVHVGQNDIPARWARQVLGTMKLVGVSVFTLTQAIAAEKDGASYLGVGPIFSTPLKAGEVACGPDVIRMIKKRVKIPIIAIGGIDLSNVKDIIMAEKQRAQEEHKARC